VDLSLVPSFCEDGNEEPLGSVKGELIKCLRRTHAADLVVRTIC
jgi:hypothetical protein